MTDYFERLHELRLIVKKFHAEEPSEFSRLFLAVIDKSEEAIAALNDTDKEIYFQAVVAGVQMVSNKIKEQFGEQEGNNDC